MALPNIILSNQVTNVTNACMQLKGPAGLEYHHKTVIYGNVYFWLVSVVITVCYICITNKVIQSFKNSGSNNDQGKQKIKLRVFLVVIVFFVSFGPYHMVRIPYTFLQLNLSSYTSCSYLMQRCTRDQKMNSTLSNTSIKCVRDTSVTAVVFPILYSILFVCALILNSLAAWVFFNIPSTSTFMVFLKNVVVADLLMTLTIPVKILTDAGVGPWQLRAFHCRYSAVLFYITMYISILLLGLISLDRYLKIVRPFGKGALQKVRVGQLLSAAIWVVMLSFALPNVILSDQPPRISGGRVKCTSMKNKAGLLWHEGFNYFCQVVFWGTLALMVVCYTFISKKVYESYKASKSRSQAASRRTKAKVFVVVGVFFICFAPFHFARVPYTLTQTGSMTSHCRAQNALYVAKETTLWLSATNVCLDPLIYVFLCKVFRKRLTATLCRKPFNKGTMESPTATSTQQEMSHIAQTSRLSYNGMAQQQGA
ncbi:P2Y purinoceptor 13 [Nibea albiflora]|uniref:P2Y purinoceptor 13 n=1 Tax=Nibea albiflora TaxID=240163 RepID=A0ACB7EJD2_NIBAL|nr:P2Y purinoceptor 13 [Nibea albiflora]